MSGKYALVIANTEYTDPGLSQLIAPDEDAKDFWRVLSAPDICAFDDVLMLLNEESHKAAEQIEIFFDERKPDDLLLLFFSGHGVKDENGSLYLAVKNTNRHRLRSTAIKSDFIRGVMDECRSRRQVLILDCCNSGAFAQGTKAETGGSIGTAAAFQGIGYGRVILTASDATQFAWEGDKVIGETDNSLFTHFLIKGLEGEADTDGDGRITLDELYDYTYDQIVSITPKQTPGKWAFKQQGEIVLRQGMRIDDVKPMPLPPELVEEIGDRRPYVREAAVQQLIRLMNGKRLGLARSAREALEQIAENDDSRSISRMAFLALETVRLADAKAAQEQAARLEAERKAQEEEDRLTAQKAKEERLARLEAERKAKEEGDQLAAQKAEEERLAGLEADRKKKEEAERLAAQKAEEERLARLEAERKAKEEADRIAALRAEEERAARLKAAEEAAAIAKAEQERKAREEADRLAAQKAEEERLAKQKAQEEAATKAAAEQKAKEETESHENKEAASVPVIREETLAEALPAPAVEKKPVSRTVMFGIAAVAVLVMAGIMFRIFSNPVTPAITETPTLLRSTDIPRLPTSTIVPKTPTSGGILPPPGSLLEIGSTQSYIDGAILVAVPAGEFTMGDSGKDRPEHKVTLSDYWIYSTEVTNQQYTFCVNQGKCEAPDPDGNPGYADKRMSNHPVTGVTYEQAAKYCTFVNGRLPSEAEWEKAAQGKGGSYPWGDAAPSCDLLNFNNCRDGIASVIDYSEGASTYGALNMSGNVFEWVADWYDAKYYASSPNENPTGPASGTVRSVRSSSYASNEDQVAVAVRSSERPANHRPDLGFRCVVDDPAYFAPFCELPLAFVNVQEPDTLETCPVVEIKTVEACNGSIPMTNVTFVGPADAQIDSQDCKKYGSNPERFTCLSKGKIVSISAACELNTAGEPSCLGGYSEKDNVCVVDQEPERLAGNCLAGRYDSAGQCCYLPPGENQGPPVQICPVGTFFAANSNICLAQPVQEIITVTREVALPAYCASTTSGGGHKGGGTNPTPPGGCNATQAQINDCNANAPFYSWNSSTCSCEPAK